MSENYYHDAPIQELVVGATILSVDPPDASSTRYTLHLSNGRRLMFTSSENSVEGWRVIVSVLDSETNSLLVQERMISILSEMGR